MFKLLKLGLIVASTMLAHLPARAETAAPAPAGGEGLGNLLHGLPQEPQPPDAAGAATPAPLNDWPTYLAGRWQAQIENKSLKRGDARLGIFLTFQGDKFSEVWVGLLAHTLTSVGRYTVVPVGATGRTRITLTIVDWAPKKECRGSTCIVFSPPNSFVLERVDASTMQDLAGRTYQKLVPQ